CSLTTDPGPGGLANVVTFGLSNPPGLVAGDILILESPGVVSDLIRFNPSVNGGSLFFFSDFDAGVGTFADKSIPTLVNTNQLSFSEAALGNQLFGLLYTPTAGQPGFVAGAARPVQYGFVSEGAIPEPGTLVLLATGFVGLMAFRVSRRWPKTP